jgi:hypothetical protein
MRDLERRGADKAIRNWMHQLGPAARYAITIILTVLAVLVLAHANLFSVPKPATPPALITQ